MLTTWEPRELARPIRDFADFKRLRKSIKESDVNVRKIERSSQGENGITIIADDPNLADPQVDKIGSAIAAWAKT